ncbi:hypothetical protein FEK33_19805 [Nocardia asteroides NBRC 15531]|uniref:Uncharacterized protein n=1 Tax=Nocardia asteroides NBRC 15531 TaxID=1110697 RepID=U5EJT4_NOCAS|nr:hypothetical protein [Nocardia asteroides]TLF65551.1 hypothetical protein FEK33_19805 [Nocardia asteroides NBRC 15531]UGT47688.1 hypothetical protein LT345_24820 [Nocardia asteroides]SFM52541.1 hypothetical protein SAMN05444423_103265 [Nocardia asteroides]VEG33393.1 Uncharacterised protein [Nocardia asteroides]GAD87540.1 hypothetical protein NCAST_35_00620 [Nocardia asteroides NBRC 15531]
MARPINDILDDGAPGLQYFEQLGPRYVDAFGGTFDFYTFVRPYDNERDMNIAKLEAAANALRQFLTTADTKITAQQSAAQSIQTGWQGAAAVAAAEQLGKIATMAAEDRDDVRAFEAALSAAAAQIPGLVQGKADTVLKLMDGSAQKYVGGKQKAVPTVGGLDPTAIDRVIKAAKTGSTSHILNPDVATMTGHRNAAGEADVPDSTVGISGSTTEEYKDAVEAICKKWLSLVFMPDYNDKVQAFTDQCTTTKIGIENLFTAVETAAAGIVSRGYPLVSGTGTAPAENKQQPQGDPSTLTGDQSKTNGGQTTAAGTQTGDQTTSTGGQTTAAGTQTGDTTTTGSTVKTTTDTKDTETATDTDTTTDDTTDDDSDTSDALSTLTSTISELGTTLSEALTGDLGTTLTSAIETVGTSISDGIEQMTEQASSLLSGEQEASFQIGDTKLSFEAGENGLSLTTTDANGGTTEYRLSLDENGNPVLTQDSSTTDDSTADTAAGEDEQGVLGSGTPQSGTGEGEAGVGDGGVTSGPDATSSDTPDLTNAPVTSEIGSGEPSSGSVAGGVPVGPRSARQETDGEHLPSIDVPVTDPGGSGAVLAEAGPL